MEEEGRSVEGPIAVKMERPSLSNGLALKKERRSASTSPNQSKPASPSSSMSPGIKAENESASTPDTEPAPKLSKKASTTKARPRPPPLFDHLPDATEESTRGFQVISDCLYGSKHMGSSQHDALDCDCSAEWRK